MKSVAESGVFVRDFLVARGLKNVVLGGHSFGGAVGQSMALRHAEYLKALLLIGTGAKLRVALTPLMQLECATVIAGARPAPIRP